MENAVVTINEMELPIKEWDGERVVTFKDVANVHEVDSENVKRNFNRNKEHFIEGIDFFSVSRNEFRDKMSPNEKLVGNPNVKMILLTESGYLMAVKSLTDKKSWDVQRKLVNSYFKLKEVNSNISKDLPVDLQSINKTVQELSNNFNVLCQQVNSIENAFDQQFIQFKEAIEKIQFVFNNQQERQTKSIETNHIIIDPIRDTIKPLAELYNDHSIGYNSTYRKVYAAMPVDWKNRQGRHRNKRGNKNNPSKLYLIESDKKLLKMFTDTVSQLLSEAMEVSGHER